MTTLLFVRHGESEANRKKFFAGQLDVPLLDSGVEQAEITADYIAKNFSPSKVYASDLIRAKKTGEVIAKRLGLPVVTDSALREIYAGKWQGKSFDLLVRDYGESYRTWREDIGNCVCDGGESISELGARVLDACARIAIENEGETVVIATHATPIRALTCLCGGSPISEMKSVPWVPNASVTSIRYDSGKWTVLSAGEDGHLKNLRTVFPSNV